MFDYLEGISSSPLTCICFLTETEVLCCNSLSQMKLWDLRVAKSSITANINNFTQVILIFIINHVVFWLKFFMNLEFRLKYQ